MTDDYILYLTLNGYLTFHTVMTKNACIDNELKNKTILYIPTLALRGCLSSVEVLE